MSHYYPKTVATNLSIYFHSPTVRPFLSAFSYFDLHLRVLEGARPADGAYHATGKSIIVGSGYLRLTVNSLPLAPEQRASKSRKANSACQAAYSFRDTCR
jgi:hypothetical protein